MSRRRPLHPQYFGQGKDSGDDDVLLTNGKPAKKAYREISNDVICYVVTAFHFLMVVFYGWLLYYSSNLMIDNHKILDPKGKIPSYGGRFKFLTHINQWVQIGFFSLQFLTDIFPHRPSKKHLQRVCDVLFTTLAFPLSVFVAITFWGIYAIDRKLVYPEVFDEFVPQIINHFWHTTIAAFVLLEMYLFSHSYPSTGGAASVIFTYSVGYITWVVVVFLKTGFWVYPFLRLLQPVLMSLFFSTCMFFNLGIYLVGRSISAQFWGDWYYLQ